MLADDVRLNQATHPVRVGAADVGMFFIIYAKIAAVWLVPAWLEGQEVIAVFESRLKVRPSYFIWLEWRGTEITLIRDYKYVRYVMAGAELILSSSWLENEARQTASSIHQLKDLRHRTMSTMPPSWEVIGRRTKECADSDKSMVTIREKHQQVVPEVLLKAFTLHRRLLTNWRKATSQTPMDLSYRRFSPNVAHDSWRISLRANDKASRYHLKRFGAAVGLKSGRTRVQSSRIVAVIRKHNLSSPQAVPGTRFGAR
jgi:hypothetical protein